MEPTVLTEPKQLFERLEFDKVLDLLRGACLGSLGIEAISALPIHTNRDTIVRLHGEVAELKAGYEQADSLPLGAYEDITEDLEFLEVNDYVLPEPSFQRINRQLRLVQEIFRYFQPRRQELYPLLYNLIRPVHFEAELIAAIDRVIDEEGNIRPTASPELMRIKGAMASIEREIDKVYRGIIQSLRNQGLLSDSIESFRNGRRVLSVPAEHKRKVKGIIHDESATGKTVFIEPEAVVILNNDIAELEAAYRREVYKVLKELSAMVRPYASHLYQYQHLLVRLDVVYAKAQLALRLKAHAPQVVDQPNFGFRRAYHPLLLLKNQQQDKPTIPFDMALHTGNRILLLSGPNAGGKSITMKSVGLLQLMGQCGMLLPASPDTVLGIFHTFFADIGDQQSIEDDLSTYSSHLKNMKRVCEIADARTLVLIDEFGGGTDPKIGGSIAEAVLRDLNDKKVFGVITTHYSNLKLFAYKAKGMVNAAMLFNKDHLTPTFELRIGRPGSSYGFEVATKAGLPEKVLKYARHRIGDNEKAVDELLIDLQREKQELESKLAELSEKQQILDRLTRTYENMHRELEFRRKKLKLEVKEQSLQQSATEQKELEKLVRDLKEQQAIEKAKALAEEKKKEAATLATNVQELKEEVYYKNADEVAREIKVGDFVKLRTGGATGKVLQIKKDQATIVVGAMTLHTKLRDLLPVAEPLAIKTEHSVKTDLIGEGVLQKQLDVRGMTKSEATQAVETFMDRAVLQNVHQIRIIHGKGTGALRKVVWDALKTYPGILDTFHPEATEGGDGATVVVLGV